jgi:hypothetical protein
LRLLGGGVVSVELFRAGADVPTLRLGDGGAVLAVRMAVLRLRLFGGGAISVELFHVGIAVAVFPVRVLAPTLRL